MNNRIKQIRKIHNLTQSEFGKKIGVKANTITGYENGLRKPSNAIIQSICREFNVDYMWLTTGVGEMFCDTDDDLMAAIDNIMFGENEFHKKLFKIVANMNDDDLKTLEHIMYNISDIMRE